MARVSLYKYQFGTFFIVWGFFVFAVYVVKMNLYFLIYYSDFFLFFFLPSSFEITAVKEAADSISLTIEIW